MKGKSVKPKVSAILSADVAGYNRLMEENAEATARTLGVHQEAISIIIDRQRGRILACPADRMSSAFADVSDAVQCALEVQRAVKTKNVDLPEYRVMEFRIGIVLSDVMEEEGRIHGVGVDMAFMIGALADPGGICISGSAYDQVVDKLSLDYQDLGEHTFENMSEPVKVYRVHPAPGEP